MVAASLGGVIEESGGCKRLSNGGNINGDL
jgi:hypothetical protein